jgi:hypothetical protein
MYCSTTEVVNCVCVNTEQARQFSGLVGCTIGLLALVGVSNCSEIDTASRIGDEKL